jgi:hypothetical protein
MIDERGWQRSQHSSTTVATQALFQQPRQHWVTIWYVCTTAAASASTATAAWCSWCCCKCCYDTSQCSETLINVSSLCSVCTWQCLLCAVLEMHTMSDTPWYTAVANLSVTYMIPESVIATYGVLLNVSSNACMYSTLCTEYINAVC